MAGAPPELQALDQLGGGRCARSDGAAEGARLREGDDVDQVNDAREGGRVPTARAGVLWAAGAHAAARVWISLDAAARERARSAARSIAPSAAR